jgi:hypothetical protein
LTALNAAGGSLTGIKIMAGSPQSQVFLDNIRLE